MINGRSILGLIPARGGSKGVPRKNIRLVGGHPLIAWTIREAAKSKYLDRFVLSSEDLEIMQVAVQYGCEVPFTRPRELADDDSPGISPVLHALDMLPGYDYVVLLQPTSPLRTAADIDAAIELCEASHAKACVSVVRCREHPYLMFARDSGSRLHPLLPQSANLSRRQQYPDFFLLNGAVYVAATQWLKTSKSFLDDDTVGYEMPSGRSLDIDTAEDFDRLEAIHQEITANCRPALS